VHVVEASAGESAADRRSKFWRGFLHALEVEEHEDQEVERDSDDEAASGSAHMAAADLEDPGLEEGEEREIALGEASLPARRSRISKRSR
jgi:hypothetical protein